MKNALLLVALFAFTVRGAIPPPNLSLPLNEKEAREIGDLIKAHYVDPSLLSDKQATSVSVSEAVANSHGGVALFNQVPATTEPPIYAEMLPRKIGYWRLSSFKPATDWVTLQNQLLDWLKEGVTGIILDVRNFEAINDYAGAAQAASYFSIPDAAFFSIQGLKIPQQVYRNTLAKTFFPKPVIILMNHRTVGAAEAFAAALRSVSGSVLVGRSTAGEAALFENFPLQSSGRDLRLAVGRAILGDGTPLYGKPVLPDIDLYVDDAKENEVIAAEVKGTVSPNVQELPSRSHLSEAALVHDETPELDEVLEDQLHEKKEVQLQDIALIRAMDVLQAIDLSQNSPFLSHPFGGKK